MGTPLELAVRALKHVGGAKPSVVLEGEVEVGKRVGFGLFQKLGRRRADGLDLLAGPLVELAH